MRFFDADDDPRQESSDRLFSAILMKNALKAKQIAGKPVYFPKKRGFHA